MNKNEMYMSIAKISALMSEDPNTKVGVCTIDNSGEVISVGYNHMPSSSECYPWNRIGNKYETKYPYVIHAEMDALSKADKQVHTLYTTHFPCSNCAKHIVTWGIKKVIFNEYIDDIEDIEISKNIFYIEGIQVIRFSEISDIKKMNISFIGGDI